MQSDGFLVKKNFLVEATVIIYSSIFSGWCVVSGKMLVHLEKHQRLVHRKLDLVRSPSDVAEKTSMNLHISKQFFQNFWWFRQNLTCLHIRKENFRQLIIYKDGQKMTQFRTI